MSAAVPAAAPLLEVRGLAKAYRQGSAAVEVLHGLDLTLAPGQRLAISGRSGSGKSTLLNLLAGLDAPDAGAVLWTIDGRAFPLERLDEAARTAFRRRHVGFVFQFFNLVPTLTAAENVALMAELCGLDEPLERARAGLLAMGLGHRLDAWPETLSGGEQQRVAIARALVHAPAVVLADEPTGNLDRATGDAVFAELGAAVAASGAALVLVTHDLALAEGADLHLDLGRGEGA
ncbi:MAG TPA: ABC transporter ATP-binding protein [Pseudomonadales bacterium]|nr:ABC transporter ATP-binding protein [Pseudomonadales bacterium]